MLYINSLKMRYHRGVWTYEDHHIIAVCKVHFGNSIPKKPFPKEKSLKN